MAKSYSFPHLQFGLLFLLMIHLFFSHSGFCVASVSNSSTTGCKRAERQALLKLRDNIVMNKRMSNDFPAWDGEDCCQWREVSCDNNTGYVTKLNLHQNPRYHVFGVGKLNASQVLSPLLELEYLTHLDLSGIDFGENSIPKFMGSLRHLRYLNLSYNEFSGELTHQLSNLTELVELDLSNNYMSATRLDWASRLVKLKSLNMNYLDLSEARDSMQVLFRLPNLSKLHLQNCGLYNFQFPLDLLNISTNHSNLQFLDLSENQFESTIPHVFGYLDSLRFLDISSNNFNGSNPRWFENLKSLEYLDLSYNALSLIDEGIWSIIGNLCYIKHLGLSGTGLVGELVDPPMNFSKCNTNNFEFLSLANNNIMGNIASLKLHKFINLQYLDISDNGMHGTLGVEDIGNLSKLSHLDIENNPLLIVNLDSEWTAPFLLEELYMGFCGVINPPKWLSSQSKLKSLYLGGIGISGDLQDWLWNMTSLVEIDFSHNFLTGNLHKQTYEGFHSFDIGSNNISGPIADLFGHNCSIKYLYLNNNSFDGHIPSSFGYCTDLEELDLSHNKLSGKLPTWTTINLPRLRSLQLNGNQLGATGEIPSALCNFTSLGLLDLQENMFSGEIPDCWRTDSALWSINLSANKLSGAIPCSLGEVIGLEYLHLNDNMLSGGIPSCLNGLHQLSLLDIGGNKLWGEIPKWLNHTHFPDLVVLRLQGNMFNGTISEKLCSFPHLRVLDLSNNRFTATIPLCLGNLTSINNISTTWGVSEDNSVNEIVAGIQREYTSTLEYLTTIDLSRNYLEGSIPSELTKLSGLEVLNLSHNHLTGDIPEKIGDMNSLETLDLSMNSLCGRIPSSISSIDSMNYLNLSYNNLSGEIPTGSHFQTLSQPSVYAGNPLLCGETLTKKCSSHDEPPENSGDDGEDDHDKREKMWFYLVVMAGLATGFWGVVGTLLVNKRWRHALFRHVDDASDWLYVTVALWKVKLKRTLNLDN